MPDDSLIALYDDGDEGAMEQLVRTSMDSIYSYLRRMLGDERAAEDATQETFLRMWRSFSRFDRSLAFRPWLFAIARNVAIDSLRKKRDTPFSAFEGEADEEPFEASLADDIELPDEIAARAADARILETALATLPPRMRETVILHAIDGFTFEEIGRMTGESLHTAKSRFRRALILLRGRLGDAPEAASRP